MPSNNLNIQQVVTDWAWGEYDKTATRKQRNLREKHKKNPRYLGVNIDWSEVKFKDDTYWNRLAQDQFEDGEASGGSDQVVTPNGGLNAQMDKSAGKSMMADGGTPHSNILFQTKFTNETEENQEYTMKTDKTTTSVCETVMESCYTRGVEMSCSLKTPGEIFEANAGFSRELSLTNSEGETTEEQVSWGVESKITVKPQHVADAELVVNEKKFSGDFTIESKIWGFVYVTFTNLRDNNAMVKATGYDIDEIVKKYLDTQTRIGKPLDFVEIRNSVIYVKAKGKCKFRFGIKQEVKVKQIPIKGSTSSFHK